MIDLRQVSYTYPGSRAPVLQEINFSVADGECVALAGPSGCGKSTLLYLLNGLIPHALGGELSGEVRVAGMIPAATSLREISRRVATVFQNPEVQLFMPRVAEDIAFGCENLRLPPAETRRRVERALAQLSLIDLRDREVPKLSGGETKRVAIAGTLAMGSRLLLLDEPTSDLDAGGQAELLAALQDLRRAGHTIVISEHRLQGLAGLLDRVVLLDGGRIVSDGPFPPPTLVPRNLNGGPHRATAPLVDLQNVSFSYAQGECAIRDMSFSVSRGEVVALLGPNGAGKTTLLKLLCGLLRPTVGDVAVEGRRNPGLSELVGRIGYLFQNPDEQLFAASVSDEIAFGPANLGRDVDPIPHLERFGLERYRDAHPLTLSRGERQRLAAAAVLATEPDVLLLDEPTTGLDQRAWSQLMDIVIGQAVQRNAGVVFSTHHREVADAFAHRAVALAEGRIVDDRVL
jgi:energy-coupling factor transporter ATP-binding protein EcfA2